MRTVSPAAAAVLAGGLVPMALLIEMDLTQTLYLNTSALDLVINGTTYLGTKGLGKIAAIADTPAEVRNISFELSGVPSSQISLALSEPVQGKAVRIKTAIFDPVTYQVLDVRQRWAGVLEPMTINDAPAAATINITAEHSGIDLTRPATSLYDNAEQQRLHPGDLFLQFVADQVDRRIIWPTSEFGKK